MSASQYTVLYAFASSAAGDTPRGTLLFRDAQGSLYGTTVFGGSCTCGNIFKIAPNGAESVLYTFLDGNDGAYPYSGVVMDQFGDLYGTTYGDEISHFGTLYRLSPNGSLTTLHGFCSQTRCIDGSEPIGGLVGFNGSLFGTTWSGGDNGYGTIFKYTQKNGFRVMYSFRDGNDGGYPLSDLITDGKGHLYGTASQGGNYGAGTVFEFTPKDRRFRVLHTFTGGNDGVYPEFALTRDDSGNLYGTTSAGGNNKCANSSGCGTIFKIDASGTEIVLYALQGTSDGSWPSGMVLDSEGNLYGATRGSAQNNDGVVFELSPSGAFTALYDLNCAQSGCTPYDSPITDGSGHIYGTMGAGGTSDCVGYTCGTVFELTQ